MATSSSFHLKLFSSSSAINPKARLPKTGRPHSGIDARACAPTDPPSMATQSLRLLAKTAIALVATGPFLVPRPAWSTPVPVTVSQAERIEGDETNTILTFLGENESLESMKTILQEKLNAGRKDEAMKILDNLADAQPFVIEWKLLTARMMNEMGQIADARKVFEEILEQDPLSFEALFENAVLMERCGEGEAAIERLRVAIDENQGRDARIAKGEMMFIEKKVEDALKVFDELIEEDGGDFRPYFCRGVIYSVIGREEDAREEFVKYRDLAPRKILGF